MSTVTSLAVASHFIAAHWRWRVLHGARLHRFQEERAQKIVAFAAGHSPFYRRHWRDHDQRAWRSLPTVDKRAMMERFDTFNTAGVTQDAAMAVALAAETTRDFTSTVHGLTVGLSSGTSGHRGLFLVSPQEQAQWAGVILARAIHSLPKGPLRVAFFLRSFSNLYAQAGRWLLQLRYFDLMTPLEEAVPALNDYQPHLIVAPPSLLGFLAKAQQRGALHIAPQRLISVAEVLEPQDAAHLAGFFQAPVHQIYQCTEGLLAVSCAHGSLHIQEDIVAVQLEPLASGDPASHQDNQHQGAFYTPILTDLWRRTQPIIRYRLNDVLRLDPQPCRCGSQFRVIAAIEGRCDDVCYFPTTSGNRRPVFPDALRRMVLLSSPSIIDYQIVQCQDGHLRIHLDTAPGVAFGPIAASVTEQVQRILGGYDCLPARLEIERGLLLQAAGTKRRRVRREDGC
ncbi:MAG: adenylate cyclase [Caldilineaceae bacterium]|nr:adenylate cyclase [Caldilineaceae bacterium]